MKLSIVICTTGVRPELADCLNSLKESSNVEVVIINNSKNKFPLNTKFKVINERKINISHVRNIGWKNAKGEYVAYIDDDSIADKDWIKNILAFIKKHPNVEVFGGPYNKHTDRKLPLWIPKDIGTLNNGSRQRKLDPQTEWLSATNIVIKKELLKKINGFNTKVGMRNNKLFFGEETDLQIRIKSMGIEIWYCPKIIVSHLFHERKMNIFWIIKDSFNRGRSIQQLKNLYSEFFNNRRKKFMFKKDKYSFTHITIKLIQYASYMSGSIIEKFSRR